MPSPSPSAEPTTGRHDRGPSFHFHSEQSQESRQLAYKAFLQNGQSLPPSLPPFLPASLRPSLPSSLPPSFSLSPFSLSLSRSLAPLVVAAAALVVIEGDVEAKRLTSLTNRRKKMFDAAFAKRQSIAVESEMSKLDTLEGSERDSKLRPVHKELVKVEDSILNELRDKNDAIEKKLQELRRNERTVHDEVQALMGRVNMKGQQQQQSEGRVPGGQGGAPGAADQKAVSSATTPTPSSEQDLADDDKDNVDDALNEKMDQLLSAHAEISKAEAARSTVSFEQSETRDSSLEESKLNAASFALAGRRPTSRQRESCTIGPRAWRRSFKRPSRRRERALARFTISSCEGPSPSGGKSTSTSSCSCRVPVRLRRRGSSGEGARARGSPLLEKRVSGNQSGNVRNQHHQT